MTVVQGGKKSPSISGVHGLGGAAACKPAGHTLLRCSLKLQVGLSCKEHNTGQAF